MLYFNYEIFCCLADQIHGHILESDMTIRKGVT